MRPYVIPDAAWHKRLADWLEARGMLRAQVMRGIGTAVQQRPAGKIADDLRSVLKGLPKAEV